MARAAEKVLKKVKGDKLPAWATFDVVVSAHDALARSMALKPIFNFKISLLPPPGTVSTPATSSRRMEADSQATRLGGLSLGAGASSVGGSGSSAGASRSSWGVGGMSVGAGGSSSGAGGPRLGASGPLSQASVQAGPSPPASLADGNEQTSSSSNEEDAPNPNAMGECPICYEDVMGDIFKCCVNARCGRVFHAECAERWSQQRASCPMW